MADNGHGARKARSSAPVVVSTEADIVEFSWPLHVYKRRGQGGKPDVYTIGVWKATTLESICLMQPLETALTALGRKLASAGTAQGSAQSGATVSSHIRD